VRQLFADIDPTPTRDTVRSPLPVRTLVLRTLEPLVDQVLFHDLLSEAQDLRILEIDDGPNPMWIRVANGAAAEVSLISGFRNEFLNQLLIRTILLHFRKHDVEFID
jgi:hypothetical protein